MTISAITKHILVDSQKGILRILMNLMNRPEKKNALILGILSIETVS